MDKQQQMQNECSYPALPMTDQPTLQMGQASPPAQSTFVTVQGGGGATWNCKKCHAPVTFSKTRMGSTCKTHFCACILCILFCPLVCVPYCTNCCRTQFQYCPNCDARL